jgi:LuxR family maltose regulon positive regulatory protein
LDRAAADLAELPDDDPRQAVAQAVRALWYGVQFDAETTIELGSAALQRLAAQGGHDLLQRQLLIAVGNSHILREDLTAAERAMDDLAGLSPIATVNDLVVVALRARIALRRGELRQAETLGAVASQAAQDVTVGSESALRSGHYALGNVLAERGQLGEGERFLQRSVDHGLNQGWLAPAAMAELALADLRAARSGPAAGLQAVDEARHLMRSLPPNCELTVSADLTEARLRIAAGSYDQAERLLEQAAPRMDRSLTLVRLAVGRGDASRAADLLGAVPATTLRDRIMVHVLAARIAAISGDAHERDAQLLAAARLAEPEGYRLLWLTEAPGLLPRLRELVEWDTSLGPYATSVADLAAELPQNVAGAPLSEREVMVLRYLRRDATTREIAAQLDVSVNTLKTHLQSIYRKLGVTSRSGAVAAGSQSGLI